MVDTKEKHTCSGCTACVSACPIGCISMQEDEQGFLYPVIDHERCIKCDACDKVCEKAATRVEVKEAPVGYGAVAKDPSLPRKSSSGGIFSLLCEDILSQGGVVAGASFTSDYKAVRHELVSQSEELSKLRGAKYLQSDLGNTFLAIEECLRSGMKVLFSGTPCQVDGLKAFIGEKSENLICIDMVCHGVPSPMIWRKYCSEIEKKEKGYIRFVNFRHKKYPWEKPSVDTQFKNEKIIFRTKSEDPYMRLFLSDYTLRPSCYQCQHKGVNRKADITIADFWKINRVLPELANDAGNSLVLAHTDKGRDIIQRIWGKMNVKETDPIEAIKYNGSAVRSSSEPQDLDKFWDSQASLSVEKLAFEYAPITSKNGVKSVISHSAVYGLLKKGKKVNMENGILLIIEANK